MKILLGWPGHSHSTADIAYGYEKALRRAGHDVRSFDYHNRLAFYRNALHGYAEAVPGFKRRHSVVMVLASESIILEAVEFVPDVVLLINGMGLHRRAYDLLKQLCLPVVILLTESPYLDEWQRKIADLGHTAGLLTNDLSSVESLSDYVGVPVAYLPHSYDTEKHRPRKSVRHFESDVFFHGTLWPERQEILTPLGELVDDYDLHIGGINPTDNGGVIDPNDLMDNREMAQYYAGAKVAINHHRTIISGGDEGERHIEPGEAYSLGPRAYEIAACGAFQLSDGTRPELHDVFNGHIPTYKDGAELLKLVKHYLTHDAEREQKAAAALEAVQGCSFDDRAREIVIPFITEVANGSTI